MIHHVLFCAFALFGQVGAGSSSAPYADAARPEFDINRIPGRIVAKNDIRIPSRVEGLITSLPIRQGSLVAKGQLLATIDDRQAQAAVEVAEKGYAAADERAKDDVEKRYAEAAAGVAELDYRISVEANASNPRVQVIAPIEIEKKKLDWKRASLQIEKAEHDMILAGLEAQAKLAELKAAEVALEYRQVFAPFDGQVEDLIFHESEWANPGDPLLRLVQFDVMYFDTTINSEYYDPAELQGRPVTVEVKLARGRTATVKGHVLHASQTVIDASEGLYGGYKLRAEIENQRVGNFWLVRPGLPASMTIHIDQPAIQMSDPVEQSAGVK